MLTKPTNYFICLFVSLFFLDCSNDKSAELIDTNFTQEVSTDQNLNFIFNKPLVGDTAMNYWDTIQYITFEPKLNGRFKWFSESVLVFSPSTAMPPATNLKGRLTDKIVAGTGLTLTGKKTVEFRTPLLEVVGSRVFWSASEGDQTSIYMTVDFKYPVNSSTVRDNIKVVLDGKPANTKMFDSSNERQINLLLPSTVPKDQTYNIVLTVEKGLKPLNGNIGMKEDYSKTLILNSPFSIEVRDIESKHNGTEGEIIVDISQETTEDVEQFISVTPKVKYTIESSESKLKLVSDDFDMRKKYKVVVKKGLKGKHGGSLKRDFTKEISFGELKPEIRFENKNALYLSGDGQRNIGVKITSVDKVQVQIMKIYENNILNFIGQGSYRYDYNYDEYSFGYDFDETKDLGDVIWKKTYDVSELSRKRGERILNLDIEDQVKDYQGIYVVKVSSTEQYWLKDAKLVSVSDIGLVAKDGQQNITVFANSLNTAQPKSDVTLSFIGRNNQLIGKATTDANGVAIFKKPEKNLQGFQISMITASTGQDYNYMTFKSTKVNTSKFDVGGRRENLSGFDVFLYGDRDIYRPGETMYISGIVRNVSWLSPGNIPVKIKIKTPDGRDLKTIKKTLNEHGSFETKLELSPAAQTGGYSLEVYTSTDVFLTSKRISVEEFVPDRIKVDVQIDKKDLELSETALIELTATNFFGPPAANRNYEINISTKRKYFSHKDFRSYNFSIEGTQNYFRNILHQGETDSLGKASKPYQLAETFQNMGLVQSDVFVTVFDETGRPVNRKETINISTQDVYYGVDRDRYYTKVDSEVQFPLVALDKKGKVLSGVKTRVKLIKHEFRTVLSRSGSYFRYRSEPVTKVLVDKEIELSGTEEYFSYIPERTGRYELQISAPGISTYVKEIFYAYGWGNDNSNNSFEVNPEGQIDITLDKTKYEVGETANVILTAPFSGRVLVTLESDEVLQHFYVDTDNRSASFPVTVTDEFVPNVYITATLFKPHEESDLPLTIAHGAAPILVENTNNKLDIAIEAPDKSRSRTKQTIKVKSTPNTAVSLAIVDEGILQLTQYKSPDPYNFFYRKKALRVKSYDIYPFLFPEIDMASGLPGGDGAFDSELQKRVNPLTNKRIKLVAFWSGILETDDSGNLEYEVDIPQFSGDLRIMATAYKEKAFGSASDNMKVADPLVISTSIPRFLSPGDTLVMPVTITNTTEKEAACKALLEVDGPIQIIGNDKMDTSVPANSERRVTYKMVVDRQIGQAKINVAIRAFGESFANNTDITVRPAAPLQKLTGSGFIAGGKTGPIKMEDDLFLPQSRSRKLIVSRSPMVEFTEDLGYLVRYPYGCVEQTVSAVFPQLYFQDLAKDLLKQDNKNSNPNYHIMEAIKKLQLMQLYNGGLTYWPSGGYESWWGSVYAAHFLYEAQKAGFEVDQTMYARLLDYLVTKLKSKETIFYYYNSGNSRKIAAKEVPYSLYVLALAGKAQRSTMNYYKNNKDALSLDGKYLLAATYALIGDDTRFRQVLPDAFDGEISKRISGGSFYSYIRDEALALNVLLDVDAENPQIGIMAKHLSSALKKNRYLNTQERVFSFLALGKIARLNANSTVTATIKSGGKTAGKFDGKTLTLTEKDLTDNQVSLEASGEGNLYYFWESEGISSDGSFKEEDSFLKVRKTFFDRNGRKINSNRFRQNDLVVVRLSINTTNNSSVENVAMTDILPAGFEIENPRITEGPGTKWITNKSRAQYMDVRDDRISFFFTAGSRTQNYYYVIRAVSKGTFQMGPVGADAMYDGEYHSYSGGGSVIIE